MKKILIILISLAFSSNLSFASYSKTYLWELISKSEIIVSGEIVDVNGDSFKIAVSQKIKGDLQPDTIVVTKFRNWSCASRYEDYEVKQKGIYFLKFNLGNYSTLGVANEGELLVKDSAVYIEEDYYEKFFPHIKIKGISDHLEFIKLNIKIVLGGIIEYLENQDKIDTEFDSYFSRTIIYQKSYVDKLIKNDFLKLVLYQRKDHGVINLR